MICPEYHALHYSTTNRDGYREYKSRAYLCKTCPTRGMCTENAKCEKTVLRHVWQDYVEMAEHIRHMAVYKELYRLRKEKIERVFADAKEKHGMRYTQYRGLAQVTNWVKLKFAAMNLKKLSRRKSPAFGLYLQNTVYCSRNLLKALPSSQEPGTSTSSKANRNRTFSHAIGCPPHNRPTNAQ